MKIGLVYDGNLFQQPLGLATVAALSPQHDVEIVNLANFTDKYDVVGMYVLTSTAPRLYDIADRIRAPTIMGGPHVSLMKEEALEHADAVVVGSAEGAWERVLSDIRVNINHKVYYGNDAADLWTKANHNLLKGSLHDVIYLIEVTRGCNNRCNYCVPARMYGAYRQRPIEDIVDELSGVEHEKLWLVSDNLSCDREYALDLFSALKKMKKRWFAAFEIERTASELLEAAAQSGCRQVFVGFDSIEQSNLEENGSKRVERYQGFVKKVHDLGMTTMGCFMFGFDHDTEETFKATAKFIDDNNIFMPVFTIFTPFPGTPAFEKYKDRLTTKDWSKFDFKNPVFTPNNMSQEELKKKFEKICSKYFTRYFSMFSL